MSSNVVILCEDDGQYYFAKAYLSKLGYNPRQISPRKLKLKFKESGGSGEDYVRKQYIEEVNKFRKEKHQKNQCLVVMIDGDQDKFENTELGLINKRKHVLNAISPRNTDEKIAIFVPTYNIESWVKYIENYDTIKFDEDYKHKVTLKHSKAAIKLHKEICTKNKLPDNMPLSLKDACQELHRIKPQN
jgi:hypothetical protein